MIDLTAILTDPGQAVAAAAVITGLIALLKSLKGVGPILDGNEPTAAFVLSAVLVLYAAIASGVHDPQAGFSAFLAWFGIAQVAMGVHDTVKAATQRRSANRRS